MHKTPKVENSLSNSLLATIICTTKNIQAINTISKAIEFWTA